MRDVTAMALYESNDKAMAEVSDDGIVKVLDIPGIITVSTCGACETNAQGYRINSILMSDFVYPSWFKATGTKPYDYRGLITAPFQVLSGGYLP